MKITTFYRILFSACLVFILVGCAEDERLMYEDVDRVYFTIVSPGINSSGPGVNDSLNYSFAFATADVQRDTIYLRCRISGKAADRDRRINIIAEQGSNAKAGYHYQVVNPIIPAGAYENEVPVIVYRKPGLQDSLVTARLRIIDSEDLLAGYNDVSTAWPVSRAKYTRQEFKLTITDRLVKPANWDNSWFSSFGEYSAVKIRFISNATGFTNWTGTVFPQDRAFLVQTAYYALYEYELANGDLLDENGKPVKFF